MDLNLAASEVPQTTEKGYVTALKKTLFEGKDKVTIPEVTIPDSKIDTTMTLPTETTITNAPTGTTTGLSKVMNKTRHTLGMIKNQIQKGKQSKPLTVKEVEKAVLRAIISAPTHDSKAEPVEHFNKMLDLVVQRISSSHGYGQVSTTGTNVLILKFSCLGQYLS